MGQNSSSLRGTSRRELSQEHIRDTSTSSPSTSTSEIRESTRTNRRVTLRKSILGLVKPNPKSSGDSSNQEGKRKSWRRSRRWSRAPVPQSALEMVSSEPGPTSATSATILPTTAITSPKEGDAGVLAPALIETQQPSSSPVAEPLASISGEASPSSSPTQHDATFVPQSPEQDQSNSGSEPEKPSSALSPISSQSPSTDPGLLSIPDHEDESLGTILPSESSSSPNTEPSAPSISPPSSTNPASTHPETVEQPISTHPASQPEQETQVPSQPSLSSTPPSSTSNTASPPNNRPFPPPGTLVVVQGVVHTTDVPRPTTASGETSLSPGSLDPRRHSHIESEPSRLSSRLSDSGLGSIIRRRSVSSVAPRPRSEVSTSRNRLSALFSQGSRPSSSRSRASSAADLALDASSVAPEDVSSSSPVPVAESASGSPASSSRTADTSSTSEATTVVTEESGSSAPRSDSNTGSPPSSPSSGVISSSSIDVLGTLLSVAAAATAASLLTGSSEPILSSPHIPRPAPFGGLTLGRQQDEEHNHINAIGRADRMRQAWGSIRERLGLRPNSTPSSLVPLQTSNTEDSTTGAGARGPNEDVPLLTDVDGRVSEENSAQSPSLAQPSRSSTSPPRPPAVEARERMLSDMARAFQLGLGLNAPIATGVPASGNDRELGSVEGSLGGGGASDPLGIGLGLRGEMPPEGSFERFLVDLQTDLRVALGGSGSSLNNQNQPEEREPEPEDDEREGGQREGRENDATVDELFRLIAEAEAEVRQRQRMIAQRQAALRALVAGAGIPETLMDRGINATSPSLNAQAASESIAASAVSDPAPAPAPAPSRRARVEDAEDTDDGMPPLHSVSDSDSAFEHSESSDEEDEGAVTRQQQQQQQQRMQASLARLSSMVNPAATAAATPTSSSSSADVNSISQLLNQRRTMGIGRRPGVRQPAPPPPASEPELEPEEDSEMPALEPIESAPISTTPRNITSSSVLPAPTSTSTPTPTSTSIAAPELPSASTSPTPTVGSPTHRPIGSRTAVDDATGRINWWRLYRFPPIAAPPPRNGGTTAPRGNDATTPAAGSILSPASQPVMSSVASPASSTSPAPAGDSSSSSSSQAPSPSQAQSPTPPATAPNTVVPVIVVGLQSVNLPLFGIAGGANPTTEPTAPAPASAGSGTEHEEHEEERESEEQDGADGDNRRRWHSRAAEALRNLRPGGRRQTPRPGLLPDVLDGPGSRTFLIYVIGGYYPPDHHMVTGDPDTLDSFEALLDLADLLGVKPPTVSKEDIERSGLEIIKSTQLKQYEAEGKISYNCTDRCLICLDDYEAEDDVRVLTCKHAFHMGCVDKWLQEGKNNCPACRGTGVPAGSS